MSEVVELQQAATDPAAGNVLALSDFIRDFGDGLLDAVRVQNPPVYDGVADPARRQVMQGLTRKPFEPQQEVVQAVSRLLIDENECGAIINGEMGCGKTMLAIAAAAVFHQEDIKRTLVIAPPHLVYKWRREIRETVPGARVWILNGPDTLKKLLQIRAMREAPTVPEFFIMGRVRMRMGFNWRPAFNVRTVMVEDELGRQRVRYAACPRCGAFIEDGESRPLHADHAYGVLNENRSACLKVNPATNQPCRERLWTLTRSGQQTQSRRDLLMKSLQEIPTIGQKTAQRLVTTFGDDMLAEMLEDNVYDFINLMDEEGELFFSDSQARRMERAMANTEFAFGTGGYQPTEFIKRQLPQGYFGLLIADEAHEFKNADSAQGQAMGVLASKAKKVLLLTGTLMGGYGDDLFYLLYRLNPRMMIEDGFRYNARRSLGAASMAFMREHGVLKDIFKSTSNESSHRTAKGRRQSQRTAKGPGFGPKGIMRYVLPYTAFLKLKDIGSGILPAYQEHYVEVAMSEDQAQAYRDLSGNLTQQLRQALVKGDTTLLGVVINVLLAWPDCAFRTEVVRHPRSKETLAYVPALFDGEQLMPKEAELLAILKREKARGRKVLVYSTYTGTRDTTTRLKALLDKAGFKTAVLRATVDASKREDWLFDQVDRGVEVVITNPELVKTGLDMLEFPTIVFLQTSYNVYVRPEVA